MCLSHNILFSLNGMLQIVPSHDIKLFQNRKLILNIKFLVLELCFIDYVGWFATTTTDNDFIMNLITQ